MTFGQYFKQKDLKRRFHDEMLRIYDKLAIQGYRPSYFKRMVENRGGLEAAKQLLKGRRPSDGFRRVRSMGMLHVSVEALALREPWRDLFTEAELEEAQRRLDEA